MVYQCQDFSYEVMRKRVKHMTIRITPKAEVTVTVPLRCPERQIREFVAAKSGWVRRHLAEMEKKQVIFVQDITFGKVEEEELLALVRVYLPAFAPYHVMEPQIRFRRMKSRWGSCNKTRGTITLNKALCMVPQECRIYVVVHELAHLVEMNHSAAFYRVVENVLPEYKNYEKRLRQYALQDEK